jgi:hypothetical protein
LLANVEISNVDHNINNPSNEEKKPMTLKMKKN